MTGSGLHVIETAEEGFQTLEGRVSGAVVPLRRHSELEALARQYEIPEEVITGSSSVQLQYMINEKDEKKRLQEEKDEAHRQNEKLAELASHDLLTGLATRGPFEETIGKNLDRAARYNESLSLAMIDIDRFKRVNDTFGHDAGDEVLKYVAGVLKNTVRDMDFVARWGGEEFIVALPCADLNAGVGVIEKCRLAVKAQSVRVDGREISVTISAGIAAYEGKMDFGLLRNRADEYLRCAKEKGRDRVLYGR